MAMGARALAAGCARARSLYLGKAVFEGFGCFSAAALSCHPGVSRSLISRALAHTHMKRSRAVTPDSNRAPEKKKNVQRAWC